MGLMPVSSKTQKIRFVTLLEFIKNDVSKLKFEASNQFCNNRVVAKRNKIYHT